MNIDFFNKNVANASFKICWGIAQCTPVFTLEMGAIGSYDLSFSHDIRPGTQCYIYAWTDVLNNAGSGVTFTYEKGRKANETFNYSINNLTHKAHLEMVSNIF